MNVTGVWLRRVGQDLLVLIEVEGEWRPVIRELADGKISHIVEEPGMASAPRDTLTH
jgi:hypothetical protein